MRPEAFGLLYGPRKRSAVASIAAFYTRLNISPATERPPTRLFSDIAASTPPFLFHQPTKSPNHNNAVDRLASSFTSRQTTYGSLPSHPWLRQFSTTSGLAKKSSRQKRKAHQLQPETANTYKHQEKTLRLGDGLSKEQRIVLDLVLNQGKSAFFTGPAGTGKSLLLRKIIEGLTIKYLDDSSCVAVTASTGLAAFNIGGTTLHRFAGIGLGKAPTTKLIQDIFKDKFKLGRWTHVKVLVIDEISMVDSTLFDKLDIIARAVRGIDLPFGGIQLVITGDFFQLPPVLQGLDDGSPRFCFEAKAWKTAIQHTIGLTQIYRQKDPVFARMLNEIREGRLSPSTIGAFRRLHRPLPPLVDNGLEAAELFSLRCEVDLANTRRMQKIRNVVHTYVAKDGGIVADADTRKKLFSNCPAPQILQLKETAQVMLIKNIDTTLVNGSLGRIIGFANKHTYLYSRWDDEGKEEDEKWCSNATLSASLDSAPEERSPFFPVVRFQLPNGNTRTWLCAPEEWSVERWVPDPWKDDGWAVEKLATRTQVPLILAWALSIHKSQGQTLELVKVDLGRVFEMGQAYVALSRARSMDGLQVLNFDPNKVTAHPKVKAFYAKLSGR